MLLHFQILIGVAHLIQWSNVPPKGRQFLQVNYSVFLMHYLLLMYQLVQSNYKAQRVIRGIKVIKEIRVIRNNWCNWCKNKGDDGANSGGAKGDKGEEEIKEIKEMMVQLEIKV